MLYEVITEQFRQQLLPPRGAALHRSLGDAETVGDLVFREAFQPEAEDGLVFLGQLPDDVITSYSIHYTKLYDIFIR